MKSKTIGIFGLTSIVFFFAIVTLTGIPESDASQGKMYEVTITNLTPGQPLTPPLLVTHESGEGFFSSGEMASDELQQLAENGNLEPLIEMLQNKNGVFDIVHGNAPLVPANDPGNTGLNYSETFVISAEGNARYLSYASMLVCTNDGFAGLDSLRLPMNSQTVFAIAYDARTEMNTEDFADMVPPCQDAIGVFSDDPGTGTTNPAISEDGIIVPHPGVVGDEDLLKRVHSWENPVVKIEITRIN